LQQTPLDHPLKSSESANSSRQYSSQEGQYKLKRQASNSHWSTKQHLSGQIPPCNSNKHFAKAEELMHSDYDMGQTQTVTDGSQIKFGGMQIGRDPDGTLRIPQEAYIENLSNIKADLHNDIASVRTARGKVPWIATWARHDAAFAMRRLSQISPENINSEATKSCNDVNDYLKKTVKRNLIFCKLDVKSLHVVFYSDASFAGNLDLS
jgi:hypothetical protein